MMFHVRLTHSPENCWARDEHEQKATEFVERIENNEEGPGVGVRSAFAAPNEHTFYLLVESDSFEDLTGFLGPPLLHDHDADVVPVTTFGGALDTLDLE
ncbi:DUF3303 family protein [Halobacterium wangiae]|uniref:DUF3303 family protein n=1 Tax=Halobacterium wangiae TaxID=2902623 RepID=UPI001E4BEDEF|nr:DUF3303 family protein [Halobacterium wangiae]